MRFDLNDIPGPHQGIPVLDESPEAERVRVAMILIHGRGASAEWVLTLGREIAERSARHDIVLVAPHANDSSWYPQRFFAPIEENQPALDSARAAIDHLIGRLIAEGIDTDRIVLLGFSQGACLVADAAVRGARRYGAVVVLSGGLIGPIGTVFPVEAGLEGTRILVGCSETDPYIPLERVQETTEVFRRSGAVVDERIYPGMTHTVTEDEIDAASAIVRAID